MLGKRGSDITARGGADLGDTVLTHFAWASNVADEQTAVIFDHRNKHIVGPLEQRRVRFSRSSHQRVL